MGCDSDSVERQCGDYSHYCNLLVNDIRNYSSAQKVEALEGWRQRVYRYNTSLLPVVSRDPFLLAALTSGFMNSTLLLTFSTIIQITLTHIRMI